MKILQRRTSILIEVGTEKYDGLLVPVYEFRHLTFQEYLAGLALVRGHFPGHDKTKRLAERIAPLAGITVEGKMNFHMNDKQQKEFVISENWREALRLCIASCNDDDVDEAITAILTPLNTEDAEKTTRPRTVLAALCLADEPNVSEAMGNQVLQQFVQQVGENDGLAKTVITSLDTAAMELAHSVWAEKLQRELAEEFRRREAQVRRHPGSLCGMMGKEIIFALSEPTLEISKLIEQLDGTKEIETIINSVTLMSIASGQDFPDTSIITIYLCKLFGGTTEIETIINSAIFMPIASRQDFPAIPIISALNKLSVLLNRSSAMDHAAAWAMYWLAKNNQEQVMGWMKNDSCAQIILTYLEQPNFDKEATRWLINFAGEVREIRAVEPLIAKLGDENEEVRKAALDALAKITRDKIDQILLSGYSGASYPRLDPKQPIPHRGFAVAVETLKTQLSKYLVHLSLGLVDPKEPISHARIAKAAETLNLPPEEIQRRYEELAQQFGLILEWKQ